MSLSKRCTKCGNEKPLEQFSQHSKTSDELAAEMSRTTGIDYQVDHIVPIKSDIVCGLHCEANLQIIPAAENNKKGNRVWPDMPKF